MVMLPVAERGHVAGAGLACRLQRRLHGRAVSVHALYNLVASYGGPEGASSARAWSRIADQLAGSASHKVGASPLILHTAAMTRPQHGLPSCKRTEQTLAMQTTCAGNDHQRCEYFVRLCGLRQCVIRALWVQAGVATELQKLHAFTLAGFAPVALRLFPDAAARPASAYKELTPAAPPPDTDSPPEQVTPSQQRDRLHTPS